MLFYFAWVDVLGVAFDAGIHAVEDEKVFSLEISQEEGGFARAFVVIENFGVGLLSSGRDKYVLISEDDGSGSGAELLFRGRVTGFPKAVDGGLVRLEFVARPDDWGVELRAFHEGNKLFPYWDDLFVAADLRGDPLEGLAARDAVYHWDRKSHLLGYSSILANSATIAVNGDFLRDSLKMSIIDEPVSEVSVRAEVDWLQQARGKLDMRWSMFGAFGNTFTSFTPNAVLDGWPKVGEAVGGGSGWHVDDADISIYNADNINLSKISYDAFLPGNVREEVAVQFGRFDVKFGTGLRLRYDYRQARREVLSFGLKQDLQELYAVDNKEVALGFRLEDVSIDDLELWRFGVEYAVFDEVVRGDRAFKAITAHIAGEFVDDFKEGFWEEIDVRSMALGSRKRAVFFDTDRGRLAIEHALERGKALLLKSSRAIEIEVELFWDLGRDISLEDAVSLVDARLPNGGALGKVIAYRLVVDGEAGTKKVIVRLGCAIGTGAVAGGVADGNGVYVEGDYSDGGYQIYEGEKAVTVSGLAYELMAEAAYVPVNAYQLHRTSYAVRELYVENNRSSQQAGINDAFAGADDLIASKVIEDYLRQNETRIYFRLRDLAAEDRIDRGVVVVPDLVVSPKNIDLGS